MNDKIKKIYKALYSGAECTKEFLKDYLEVSSIKTVENNIKENDEIEYDIKLRKYRFKKLLPKYIPTEIFFDLFNDAIVNKTLKNDFLLFKNKSFEIDNTNLLLTSELSNMSRKIIMFHLAIKYNCVLKIEYKKANKDLEIKYIRPHSLFSNGYTFYILTTYDTLNKKNINEERTLAINGIGKIEPIEYIKNVEFEQKYDGNAYGKYDNNKFIILNLTNKAANYFKREVLFNDSAFEILNEEFGGESITVKMYYNEIIEIIKLVQQWLPEITIVNDSIIREEVYTTIKKNAKKLFQDER
jgi:hypothetical protein